MVSKHFLNGTSTASRPPDKERQRALQRQADETRRREERARKARREKQRERPGPRGSE